VDNSAVKFSLEVHNNCIK